MKWLNAIVAEGYNHIMQIRNSPKKAQNYLLNARPLLTRHSLLGIVLVLIIAKDHNFGQFREEVILTFIVKNTTVKTHGMY